MAKPLISILIPAYNAERWISETIRCALSQTWTHKEVIVVDDGSSDQTQSIAKGYERDGVRVLSQPKQGASTARNHAFSASSGQYIQWLDADDLLDPRKIALQMAAAQPQATSTVLSCSWAHFRHQTRYARFVPSDLWADLSPTDFLRLKLGSFSFMNPGVWLISRETALAAGPWNPQLSYDDDGEYFARVLTKCEQIQFISEARAYYRFVGPSSQSFLDHSPEKLNSMWLSMELQMSHLRSLEDSDRTRMACLRYLQHAINHFDPLPDRITHEMHKAATRLGGRLAPPGLPAEYAWLGQLVGVKAAKLMRRTLPRLKWALLGSLDDVRYFTRRWKAE
jgi:glycosyltransferase involved in cell wall biosynthesis